MCGIAGLVLQGLAPAEWTESLRAMTESLRHRGPDDRGLWFDASAGVGFGHRRLAVIDPTRRGRQPMESPSGRYVISYNGEIYNYEELRVRLKGLGGIFRSDTDTEVLLAAIDEWGVDKALDHTNGMFAFALWDRQTGTLHLARDRLGEKPIYFGATGRGFGFASELRAFHALPWFTPSPRRASIAHLLRLGYIPEPYSIYEGIEKLAPGTILSLRLRPDGHTDSTSCSYWDLADVARRGIERPLSGSLYEVMERTEATLATAVRRRLTADVPIGALLSGGVDSSLVVALMQAAQSQPVLTFTVGFDQETFDERPQARAVAEALRTRHREMELSSAQALDLIAELPRHFDEPLADASQLPTLLVARLAKPDVTVCLTGDGGDELFGGYRRYRLVRRLWRGLGWMPLPVRQPLAATAGCLSRAQRNALPPHIQNRRIRHAGDKLEKLAEVLTASDAAELYRLLVTRWRSSEPVVLEEPGGSGYRRSSVRGLGELTNYMMLFDLTTYLPGDLLVKVDRALMSVSLEPRLPFLDPEVVELAWRLPAHLKKDKRILRGVLRRHLPQTLTPKGKKGFSIPLADWLRGPLRPWAEALLDCSRLRQTGLLNTDLVRRRWGEHLAGDRNWANDLWGVLTLQQWLDHHTPH